MRRLVGAANRQLLMLPHAPHDAGALQYCPRSDDPVQPLERHSERRSRVRQRPRRCAALGRDAHQAGACVLRLASPPSAFPRSLPSLRALPLTPAAAPPRAGDSGGLQELQGADCDRAVQPEAELHRCERAQPVLTSRQLRAEVLTRTAAAVGANGAGKTNFFHGAPPAVPRHAQRCRSG